MANILKSTDQKQAIITDTNDVWKIEIRAVKGGTLLRSLDAVIERITISESGNVIEKRNGEGDVYFIYINDRRRTTTVTFYTLSDSVANNKKIYKDAGEQSLAKIGDEPTFLKKNTTDEDWSFLQNNRWIIDNVSEDRPFGEVRMVTFSLRAYDGIG